MDAAYAAHQGPSRVSVVIPARNEEGRIGDAVRAVSRCLRQGGYAPEIIVVDDASSDGTAGEAEQALREVGLEGRMIRCETSCGKGGALKAGFAASTGTLVGFIDADLEYPPEVLPEMADLLLATGETRPQACAVGIRTRDERSFGERATSHLTRAVARALLRLGIADTQAGIKMFPGWFARDVLSQEARETGWLFDIEALVLAAQHKLRTHGVPLTQRRMRPRRATLLAMLRTAPTFLRLAVQRWSPQTIGGSAEAARILRFAIVGAINSINDLGIFLLLVVIYAPDHAVWLAGLYALCSWFCASSIALRLHSSFTFRAQLPGVGFWVITSLAAGLQLGFAAFGAHLDGTVGAIVGKATGIVVAGVFTFLGYRALAAAGQMKRHPAVEE